MDKNDIEKLYNKKLAELDQKREELDEMFAQRVTLCKPLTDPDIIKQRDSCADVSLELAELKKMLEKSED